MITKREELEAQVRRRNQAILAQQEEVLEALIAKYGFEPDRFVQVLKSSEWSVRFKTDEDIAAGQ